MEAAFVLIRENAGWLFGSTSLAAILLALINSRRTPEKDSSTKPNTKSYLSGKDPLTIVVIVLAVVALGTGAISVSNINLYNEKSLQSITSGDNSTNINAKNSNVEIDSSQNLIAGEN